MGPPRRELPVGQILRETELGPSHPRRLKPSHCPPPSRHLNPPSHNPAMVTSGRKGFNPNKTKRKTWIENGSWNLEAPHDCTCFDCNGMRSLYNHTQFLFQYHDGHLLRLSNRRPPKRQAFEACAMRRPCSHCDWHVRPVNCRHVMVTCGRCSKWTPPPLAET